MALTGTLYSHYSQVPPELWQWRSFEPDEPKLHCSHCGEFYLHKPSMSGLQGVRDDMGRIVLVNSGHRCGVHNALVGGAPLSDHRLIAFDVSTEGHDRIELYESAKRHGFMSFGFYQTFLHMAMIRTDRMRFWYGGKVSREIWDKAMHRGGR